MKKEICFYEVKTKCTIISKIKDQILQTNNADWGQEYEWKSLAIPDEILLEDFLLKKLREKVNFVGHILGIMPYQFYDWHTDDPRSASMNLLLNDCHCHTLFSQRSKYICNFIELKYKPDTYYILNTNIDHTLINFDQPRYLLSLSFEKNLNYINLVKEVMEIEQEWQ